MAIRISSAHAVNPDSWLLQRACNGDPHALQQLLDPYWETAYRIAYRVTGHVEDAEDLAQEAFVRMIQRLPSFRGECVFGTWVYRVTLNVCLSSRRRVRPRMENVSDIPLRDPRSGPEESLLQHQFQEQVRQVILTLKPSYAEVLLLRLVEEMEYSEIGQVLGISTKTAQLRFHRGMKQLRQRLRSRAGKGD